MSTAPYVRTLRQSPDMLRTLLLVIVKEASKVKPGTAKRSPNRRRTLSDFGRSLLPAWCATKTRRRSDQLFSLVQWFANTQYAIGVLKGCQKTPGRRKGGVPIADISKEKKGLKKYIPAAFNVLFSFLYS